MGRKAERERVIAGYADVVRRGGEFIHRDGRRARMGNGDFVGPAILRELEKREVVVVVQTDLFGRPLQYGTREFRERAGRAADGYVRVALAGMLFVPDYDRRQGKWTYGNRAAAKQMWIDGGGKVSKSEIARRFKTSRGRIIQFAKADGWPVLP